MAKLRNIIQVEDPNKMPEDVDDARLLAGLLGQVANESVAICKNVDPSSVPGGADSALSSNTRGLMEDLHEIKTRKYKIPSTNPQPQSTTPTPTPTIVNTSSQVQNSTSVNTPVNAPVDNDQLELDLNPSESKQIICTLEGIESVLNRIYTLLLKFEQPVKSTKTAKKVKNS